MNKKITLMVDTETCCHDKSVVGVDPKSQFTYDVSYQGFNRLGEVLFSRSFVIADIFCDEEELMKSSYYANKIPEYWESIKKGEKQLITWTNACKLIREDIKKYGVNEIVAHNARFDYHALNNTQRWLTKSKYRYLFPNDIDIIDTLKIARQVLAPMKKYQKFCNDNGYITKTGKPKLTAEVIYRYFSGDNDFIEEHKGFEDVLIEKENYLNMIALHKKMNGRMWED